jgi:molecular chaperone HtpG
MSDIKETLGFQAEVKQLLHLMVHSLYSNKEIVLRELTSNASDACDKLRFESLADASLLESDPDLQIRVAFDKAARTITIVDNGIGMSRQEAIEHLGTIAKSGTREFFAKLTGDAQQDASLIGQFGVGFYSSFIVADRVTVRSRRAGLPAGLPAEQGVEWVSDGSGEFSVETISKPARGTEVILHLKEGEDEFLSGWKLREVLRRYADHIQMPILMDKEAWDDESKGMKLTGEQEQVNEGTALWTRSKAEITDQQYTEFYKHVAHDFEPPLGHVHARVEGRQDYTVLLYVPARAPFDLYDRDAARGVKLFVKRVFIMDNADQLLPGYLRFVRGVIDAADLPLNVSREILQQSRDVEAIRAGATKKVLGLLEDLAENQPEKYGQVWNTFGAVLKEGTGEDFANRERIAKLLRFASTHNDGDAQTVSLGDYVARMKDGQNDIYVITAESAAAARHSPHLEVFRKKGIEVLLLGERVDEWMLNHLREFDGKKIVSVTQGDLDLGDLADAEEKKAQETAAETHKALVERVQTALGERAKAVRVTLRLTDSPACLVREAGELPAHLLRMLKAAGQSAPESKPTLEINPEHALVQRLDTEQSEDRFADLAQVLFDQALLAEGGALPDPAAYVRRVNALLTA